MKAKTSASFQFPFQSAIQAPYNRSIADEITNSLAAPVDGIAKTLVSAIIPARNEEASIARVVESVAAQPEVGEVIVVNDQSTDGTGAILAELAGRIPKLRVLETGSLPAAGSARTTRFRSARPPRRATGCFSRMRTRITIRARRVGR